MNNKQTTLCNIWKYASMLWVIAIFLFFSSFQTKAEPVIEMNIVQQDTANQIKPVSKDSIQISNNLEVMPQFPCGNEALIKWLWKNITYPKEAAEKEIQGRVVVRFAIKSDGSIKEVEIVKPLDPLCDKEAMRVIKMMPKWTPGIRDGKPVDVYYSLPVTFKLRKTETVNEIDSIIKANAEDIEMPQFPGGDAALLKYLKNNISYPYEEMMRGIQGTVLLELIVGPDGSVANIKVAQSADPILDKEALRVAKAMPKWIPGKQNDKPIYVYYTLPITFKLPEYETTYESDFANYIPALDLSKDSIQIYNSSNVDVMPQFPGGDAALMKFLGDNICYPAKAVEKGTQGRVTLRFIVTPDGLIANVEVVKPLDSSFCDNEAVRVIKKMPKWIPGKQNGKPVYVYFTIPITFKMSGN